MEDDVVRHPAHVQQRHALDLTAHATTVGFALPISISVSAWLACGSPRPDMDWPGAGVLALDVLAALHAQIARSTPRMLADRVLTFGFLPDYDAAMVDLLCVYDDRRVSAQVLLLSPVPDGL